MIPSPRTFLVPLAGIALLAGVACSSREETPPPADSPASVQTVAVATPVATQASGSNGSESASAAPAQQASGQTMANGTMSVADLVRVAEPSIVRVQTNTGVGTGFVVSADGDIVTNFHVIESSAGRVSTNIRVTMSDGEVLAASVIGTDARGDLALLKIDKTGLKALPIGDLDEVVVGQDVVAIGYALDLKRGEGPSYSVTRGIVSAKNRGIEESSTILGAIQTDAAINHGNSGGPLLNMEGEVIGVNTAIAPDPTSTSGATAPGIGFAIGADTVKAVYQELKESGQIQRGLLGIADFTALRPAQARSLGIPETQGGVYLQSQASVAAGGPAAAGGLRTGDVVTKIGEFAIRNESDLSVAMIRHQPGDTVTVEFYRDGKKQTTSVTLGTPTS